MLFRAGDYIKELKKITVWTLRGIRQYHNNNQNSLIPQHLWRVISVNFEFFFFNSISSCKRN